MIEEENQLPRVAPWLPYLCSGMCPTPQNKYMGKIKETGDFEPDNWEGAMKAGVHSSNAEDIKM